MSLKGRTALITGASGAIGKAVAENFAKQGANLCLASTSVQDALAEEMRGHGVEAIAVAADVSQPDHVTRLRDAALARFGRIDILVNVAGIVSFGAAETLAKAEWDRVLAINLTGTFLCCQAVIPAMKAQKYGRIINLGSVVGKNGGNARPWLDPEEQTKAGNVAYGVTKAGVHMMTVFLAKELASHGITVNAVAPGPIASAMTTNFPQRLRELIPVGRIGAPDDCATACSFLAQDSTSFITGEILDVNGGMLGD